MNRLLKRALLVVGVVFVVTWAIAILLFDSYFIPSAAMTPTLEVGDRVLARSTGSVGHGDIVIYQDLGAQRVSRVVAVAGDSIEATADGVVRNGIPLDEPYLDVGTITARFETVVIPEGHVFVMSDNRSNARDSRLDGPVPIESISHRVVWIWSPLGRFGQP